MICTSCGHKFEGKYCPECGKAVSETHNTLPHSTPIKKPFYTKWWFWVIAALFAIIVIFGGSSDKNTTNSSDINSSTTVTNGSKATTPKVPVEFASACPITVSATIADNIIGFPELSCLISNNTDKEIAAIQLYIIPKDVYGDEVSTLFTTNKLFSDTESPANKSETFSWQLLDDEIKSGEIYIYSVYFSNGTEWGDKDTSVSNIKKYGEKITTEN